MPLPDKPSIAVLPFQNLSGDPEQEYFADGMVEEIITALSRIRWLFVIARNSSFTYRGQVVDVKRVGRELGVRYLLEGSVRKGGGRLRITAQLIEAETGAHLWADRFDDSLEAVFELQDQVATSVAGVIEPALQAAETARSAARAVTDLSAYDLYLRGRATIARISRQHILASLRLFEQAIAIDPNALAWAAFCHRRLYNDGWTEAPEETRREAVALARRALAEAAFVLGYFGEDFDAMVEVVDRALAPNPSFARGWYVSGNLRLFNGDLEAAIEDIEKSVRLSPREAIGSSLYAIGMAFFFKGQFTEAASKLLLLLQDHPGASEAYRVLAACYTHMGRLEEARVLVTSLRSISPELLPKTVHWRKAEHRDLFFSVLRLAMGETE